MESINPGALVIGVILLFLLVVVLKILKSLGKGVLLLGLLAIISFAVYKIFPGFVEPIADFIGGSWLEGTSGNRP